MVNANIAVVEDEAEAQDLLVSFLERFGREHGLTLNVSRFPDAMAFLEDQKPTFDVVFMDIGLPGMNGMDASRKLREKDRNVIIIFVTNLAQFAVRGYEVSALDFIVKPITYDNFSLKFQRAIDNIANKKDTDILVTADGETHKVNSADILYVEVFRHSLVYHCLKGDFKTYGALKDIEDRLKGGFAKCNRCYLVNLRYVDGIKDHLVYVRKHALQISYPKKASFMKELTDFIGGGGDV